MQTAQKNTATVKATVTTQVTTTAEVATTTEVATMEVATKPMTQPTTTMCARPGNANNVVK